MHHHHIHVIPYIYQNPYAAANYTENIRRILYPPPPTMSFVEQIDKILHKNISGTPLEKRFIRILEDPSAGVVVKVDQESFIGVDAVTDPEVKAAIKAAVTQWEKEQ